MEYLKSLPPTKRSVLKLSAKLFDPLGLLSPFIVNMKIWFQKLCVDKVNWDDHLEGTMLAKWNHLFNEFSPLAKLNIPRCYFVREKPVCRQLHGFSDASEQAIAAVVYLRTVYETGAIKQSIRVGDIVVLKEEGSARCWWKLAKVTELLKSRDNVVRSAKIQVLNTDAQRRPTMMRCTIQHLIPLEVNHS